jgi:hypothetical protein
VTWREDLGVRAAAGAGTPAPAGFAPFPPGTFPPGVRPETYRVREVTALLKRAAYFSIFSIANPARPNTPIPSPRNPGALIGVEVNEDLHRFAVCGREPSRAVGLQAVNRVGEPVARVHIRWMVIPDDFEAAPGREPPPTELDPSRSQRFAMLDGQLQFADRCGSGFRAFGTGRTFPSPVGGGRQLRIGAVIDILEGTGKLAGLPGTVCVNGHIEPPDALALNLMGRFLDPARRLRADSGLTALRPVPDPDPGSTFLVVLGEVDPDRPTELNTAPDGRVLGSDVRELLRLVYLDFDAGASAGLRSRTLEGPVVGSLSATLHFDPLDPRPVVPIWTTDGVFTFFDRGRATMGTLRANLVEGRAFRTPLAGAPLPVFRFGGFGPFLGGTGPFDGADGMMSLNAAISVFPRTLSNLYVLRVSDPDGRFRAACRDAWC